MSKLINIDSGTVVGKKMFGGYVYSLDCEFGGAGGRSSLTLNIVSETGEYSRPNLSHALQSISVGNQVSFKGKLVSYNKELSPGKSTLKVVYKDGSDVLDKYYVGLYKRHASLTSKLPNLIVVGKEYHPCDKNLDSSVSVLEDLQIDWCDPCPFYPENKYKETCSNDAQLQIQDVKYTFNELLSKIDGIVSITAKPTSGDFYAFPKDYSGSLRSVLQQWCNDFGLTFYWDWKNDSLNFVDLKSAKQISVDQFISQQNISSYSAGESIEDTYSRGVISYYAREAREQRYSCGDDRTIGLVPFFISDLYNSDVKIDSSLSSSSIGAEKSSKSKKVDAAFLEAKELSVGLSYYSKDMRESFWLNNYYGVVDAATAAAKMANSVDGKQICSSYYEEGSSPKELTDAEKEQDGANTLVELGDMKILDVIAPGPDGSPWNTSAWNAVLNAIQEDKKKKILDSVEGNQSDYYFIVAKCNLEKLRKQYELDASLAEEFMGRFWYRRYTPIVGGGDENYKNVSIETADGSASFYSQGSDFSGHPVCGFGHAPGSYIDKLLKTIEEEDGGKSSTGSFTATYDGGQTVTKEYEIKSNMIMAERDSKWYPNRSDIESYQYFSEYFQHEYGLYLIGSDGKPDILGRLYPCTKNDPSVVLFCVKRAPSPSGFAISVSSVENFYEIKNQKKIKRTLLKDARNSDKPYSEYREIARTGLKSTKTQWVTFDGFAFMMPVGGCSKLDGGEVNGQLSKFQTNDSKLVNLSVTTASAGSSPGSTDTPYYSVRVSQDYEIPVDLPKYQFVYGEPAESVNSVAAVDYYFFSMDSIEDELLAGQCSVNESSLKKAHAEASKMFRVLNKESKTFVDFSVFGVFPLNLSIEDGLDSFTITIGDAGVETRYSITSKYRQRPEANFEQKVIQSLGNRLSKKSIGGNLDGSYKSNKLPAS
jgi:hypothetical protein